MGKWFWRGTRRVGGFDDINIQIFNINQDIQLLDLGTQKRQFVGLLNKIANYQTHYPLYFNYSDMNRVLNQLGVSGFLALNDGEHGDPEVYLCDPSSYVTLCNQSNYELFRLVCLKPVLPATTFKFF